MITIEKATYIFTYIAKENAPVRTRPLGRSGDSPYPGNLKNNGIVPRIFSTSNASVVIGGEAAPYAPMTEFTSSKKGWIEKTAMDGANRIATQYKGRIV